MPDAPPPVPAVSAPPPDPADVATEPAAHVPEVVVGWVAAGPLDDVQAGAFEDARRLVAKALRRQLPAFTWSFPVVHRRDVAPAGTQAEPVDLLDLGATERRLGGWDFAFAVTADDLRARFRPFTLATPSQAVDVAALSLARLDPGVRDDDLDPTARRRRVAHRFAALTLHAFGHLNGLDHDGRPDAVMHAPRSPADLDASSLQFTDANRAEIEAEVADVADPRMEEETAFEKLGDAAFVVKAVLLNWADIADTVLQIRPWRFPFQLSKLTTAAFSTLVVLVMTAEAWDLGTRQPLALVTGLSLFAVVGTSAYLVRKQGLLARRHGSGRTEQQVVQSTSILLALGLGMATTYGLLFVSAWALRVLFFDAALLNGWSASLGRPVGADEVLAFTGFVAALGILVGALGASFEDQTYFRHVAYVDEET